MTHYYSYVLHSWLGLSKRGEFQVELLTIEGPVIILPVKNLSTAFDGASIIRIECTLILSSLWHFFFEDIVQWRLYF